MSQPTPNTGVCAEHPDQSADWYCPACQESWCERCVRLFPSRKERIATCGRCGQVCAAVASARRQERAAQATQDEADRPFGQRLLHAWRYPLRGQGWAIILTGGIVFWALLSVAGFIPIPFVGLIVAIGAAGYFCAYLFNVVGESAAGRPELPPWTGLTSLWDDVFRPFLMMIGVGILCYAPSIGWTYWQGEVGPVGTALDVLGTIYFPMALLSVALHDDLGGLSPHLVLPAILRVPVDYFLTCLGLAVIYFGLFPLQIALSEAVPILGGLIGWIVTLYLVVLEMHIIGTLYHANPHAIGWFERSPDPAT